MFQRFFYFFKFVSNWSLTALLANLALSTRSRRVNGQKMPTFLKSEFKSTPYKRRHGVCQCLTKRLCVHVIEVGLDQGSAKMSTIF